MQAYLEFCKASETAENVRPTIAARRSMRYPSTPYAAESPAEFFLRSCRRRFSRFPEVVVDAFPAVYAQLRLFYRQDPVSRH